MRVLILCGVIAAIAAPAQAGAVRPAAGLSNAYETTVDYSDLDLDRGAGAEAMLARIHRAARAVCHTASDPRDLKARTGARKACLRTAVEGAVAKVGSPLVTARYERSKSPAMLASR